MKSKLHVLGFVLILIILALSVFFIVGGLTPFGAIGPQGPVGPNATDVGSDIAAIGPDAADVGSQGPVGPQGHVGPGASRALIFGIDWVYVVASALVLVALGVGLAIGRGPHRQMLGQ